MSEPTRSDPKPTPRTRRRASRAAGPVDEYGTIGRPQGEPAVGRAESPGAGAEAGTDTEATVAGTLRATSKAKAGSGAGTTTVKLAIPADGPAPSTADEAGTGGTNSPEAKADDAETASASRALRPLEWAAVAVAIVSLIALIGTAGFDIYHHRHVEALAAQRSEYVQTAKQAILNLTNIKDDTAQQDIARVLSVASGDLKAEYSQQKDTYAQVVQQAKVRASGQVLEAGIESQGDDSATVLVAAEQTLTNAGDSQPQQRYYRFRVTVNRADDGSVTASKVEFVA